MICRWVVNGSRWRLVAAELDALAVEVELTVLGIELVVAIAAVEEKIVETGDSLLAATLLGTLAEVDGVLGLLLPDTETAADVKDELEGSLGVGVCGIGQRGTKDDLARALIDLGVLVSLPDADEGLELVIAPGTVKDSSKISELLSNAPATKAGAEAHGRVNTGSLNRLAVELIVVVGTREREDLRLGVDARTAYRGKGVGAGLESTLVVVDRVDLEDMASSEIGCAVGSNSAVGGSVGGTNGSFSGHGFCVLRFIYRPALFFFLSQT